jgi:hypothetical protein
VLIQFFTPPKQYNTAQSSISGHPTHEVHEQYCLWSTRKQNKSTIADLTGADDWQRAMCASLVDGVQDVVEKFTEQNYYHVKVEGNDEKAVR